MNPVSTAADHFKLTPGTFDTDVFVLGGGPAGLAAAIAARSAGMGVIVADAETPPIDKACGEGLMPDALRALAQLGVTVTAEHGHAFSGIRFCGSREEISGDFPCGAGVGVRRTVLHQRLVDRARQIGIEFLWNRPARAVSGNAVMLAGEKITSRWIVGADGTQSSLRRWAGLNTLARDSRRFSYRRHYRIAPWSDYMEIHWGSDSEGSPCQFYVTPVSDDQICLVLMARTPQRRIADVLPGFKTLRDRLASAQILTPERGALAATRRVARVTCGNLALIGDASGTVDPISGEGLCLAFKQALPLAQAMQGQDLRAYQTAHSALARRPRLMADFMLLMDRSHFLRRRTLAAFESHPRLFSNLLAMHVGELQPARFLATAAELGWQVATG